MDLVIREDPLQMMAISPPRCGHLFVKTGKEEELDAAEIMDQKDAREIVQNGTKVLVFFSLILVLITLPFSLCYCVKVVQEYERAVIFRLGRLKQGGASGPGLFFILPCIDNYSCVDLRTVSYEVPPQEMLSRDSVTVSVDAVCFYKVKHISSNINFVRTKTN